MIKLTILLFALISLSSTAAAQAVRTGVEGPLGQAQRERPDVSRDGRVGWRERIAIGRHRIRQGMRDAAREALLARIDTDGDGRIDADERDAARDALRRRIEERRRGRIEELRRRVDRNADGQIDPNEREIARRRIEERLPGVRGRRPGLEQGGPSRGRFLPQADDARARGRGRCEGRGESDRDPGQRSQAPRRRGRRV